MSSKNSRRLVTPKGGGKPSVIQSKAADGYVNATAHLWAQHADGFRRAAAEWHKDGRRLPVLFAWVRATVQTFDHTGPLEMALDCMTGHKFRQLDRRYPGFSKRAAWIGDDDVDSVVPYMHPVWTVDAQNPGVHVFLLDRHPWYDMDGILAQMMTTEGGKK